MNYRKFGKTGKLVSEIGFGAGPLGDPLQWKGNCEEEGFSLVRETIDSGINFFDTASVYGEGASETILGKALKDRREKAVITTKFEIQNDGTEDYAPNKIRGFLEGSLRRLQTDYVDAYIVHGPDGEKGHFDELEKLKNEGKILSYGASVDSSAEMIRHIKNFNIGVLEVLFNIFDQETGKAFKMAQENEVALIIKVPLDSGWLSGKYNAESRFDDFRSRWAPEIIRRRFELLEKIRFIQSDKVSLTVASLRFILSNPEITTVIPGMKSNAQLKESMLASEGTMPGEHIAKLKAMWRDKIESNPLGW
jgi:aryl-alcohol dehydrogenase-like predicted oxidoreductase